MRHGLLVLWVALVSLAGCATNGAGESEEDSFTVPSSGAGAKSITPPAAQTVRGVLTFDDIEGGCAFLEAADGTKFEVIYPDGWRLDRNGSVLRGPGDVVVPAGDTVTVMGSLATDRSSICQVGPIFRAVTVEATPR